MARYTKAFINARFKLAAEAMGWDIGPAWEPRDPSDPASNVKARVGAVYLDHFPAYGGYDIAQIVNDGGAIRQINGWANRMKAGELIAFLDGLVKGVEAAKAAGPAKSDDRPS